MCLRYSRHQTYGLLRKMMVAWKWICQEIYRKEICKEGKNCKYITIYPIYLFMMFQMSYIYYQVAILAYKILIKNIAINTPYGNKTIIILWLNM